MCILANTGGLLGFLMGFSVISVVELIYFIALRPFFRRFYRGSVENKDSKEIQAISKPHQQPQWIRAYEMDPIKRHTNTFHPSHYKFNHGRVFQGSGYKPPSYPLPSYPLPYPYVD